MFMFNEKGLLKENKLYIIIKLRKNNYLTKAENEELVAGEKNIQKMLINSVGVHKTVYKVVIKGGHKKWLIIENVTIKKLLTLMA